MSIIAFPVTKSPWSCAAYRGSGVSPVVRVLEPRAALVRAAIDDGADAVVVPYVESVDQVREVVAAAKLRPIQGERAAAAMRNQPLENSILNASKKHCGDVALIIQIESETAVSRCEELTSVDGVDGVLVGPFDLTATLGCLNDHSDKRFIESAKQIATTARARHQGAGIYFAMSPEKEQTANQWGYKPHDCRLRLDIDFRIVGSTLGTVSHVRAPSEST